MPTDLGLASKRYATTNPLPAKPPPVRMRDGSAYAPGGGYEVGNALGRLEADRPRLAAATAPGNMARLVTAVLTIIDRECVIRFGLRGFEERRRYLSTSASFHADGIKLFVSSPTGGGRRREWVLDRQKRKEELLRIPEIMDLVERIVIHANNLLAERGWDATRLLPDAKGRDGCWQVGFFDGENP
jgi:hypothetical protein